MSPHTQPTPASARARDLSRPALWLDGLMSNAASRPQATAVICGNTKISYAELNNQSNAIARLLQHSGIGPGHYVGTAFHRSPHLIPALFGVLKSGAAYIPVDPAYPAARIATMLASARLETVLTTTDLAPHFPAATVLTVDGPLPAEGPDPSENPAPVTLSTSAPVYAIFTSGSTGTPKAASVYHSGFANLLEWYRTDFALGPDDRTLVISSPSFDLTQKNLYTPVLTGGTLVLDDATTYDIPRILRLIRDHRVTLVNCTPSAFYPLIDASAADGYRPLASLRFAILGGEPISIPRVRAWLEHPETRAEVVNSYGPTECTDICLFHRLHRGNLDQFPFVPLGRQIPNVQVTIRDEQNRPLADNQLGELCIAGVGVGSGYLHDPERTASRFIDLPPLTYRTGDLAKRLPCGTFEFRGRVDHQVKINGFRIELGEIEIALADHPDVTEAVVTAADNRLTAHIQGTASEQSLKPFLAEKLPAHMIPGEFRIVESFPLTPNGKVDRNKLTTPASPPQSPAAPAGSDLESRILALWSEILEKPVTDPNANFFDIGGTSILVAVVHVRLREMTGLDFPITDLFALPNARTLAARLSPASTAPQASAAQSRAAKSRNAFARFKR